MRLNWVKKELSMIRNVCYGFMMVLAACAHADVNTQTFTLEKVADGVYVHHGVHLDIDAGYQGDICNISIVVGSNGVAVIDTGGSLKVGKQLRDAIRTITDQPILYVINTHVHPDHMYGNAAFLEDHPQFVGHTKLGDAMRQREDAYTKLNLKYLGADATGSVVVTPTLPVKLPVTLSLGDRTLAVTPYATAHTHTDLTVLDNHTGTLFTGDLLFIERTPVVEGDIKGLITAIDTLKTYSAKRVVPGHGPVANDWVQALNNEQRYLNTVLTDVRTAIKNGDSMEHTMATAAASERDRWLLFEITNRRNVNNIFSALEWE
jgi:quinoprotein relay system zinc metallohydrolase 2